jgi:hypothetical protein
MNKIVGANPIMNSTRQTGGEGRRKICHACWAYWAMHIEPGMYIYVGQCMSVQCKQGHHACWGIYVGRSLLGNACWSMQTRPCMFCHVCWPMHVGPFMASNSNKVMHVGTCMLAIPVWPAIHVVQCKPGRACCAMHVGPFMADNANQVVLIWLCLPSHVFRAKDAVLYLLCNSCWAMHVRPCISGRACWAMIAWPFVSGFAC